MDAANKAIRLIYPLGTRINGLVIDRLGVTDPEPTMFLFWTIGSIFAKFNPTYQLYGLSEESEEGFNAAHGNQFESLPEAIKKEIWSIYNQAEVEGE
jgi:hypothetical protein